MEAESIPTDTSCSYRYIRLISPCDIIHVFRDFRQAECEVERVEILCRYIFLFIVFEKWGNVLTPDPAVGSGSGRYQQWHPVQYGEIRGDKVTFEGMGKDLVYLPAFYCNGKIIPAQAEAAPFLVVSLVIINVFVLPAVGIPERFKSIRLAVDDSNIPGMGTIPVSPCFRGWKSAAHLTYATLPATT